jgi:hypothetical protein
LDKKEKIYLVDVQSPELPGMGVHVYRTTQSYTVKTDKPKKFIKAEFKTFFPKGWVVKKITEKK